MERSAVIKMLCLVVLIGGATICGVAQTIEMKILALNGKDGKPLTHQRVVVFFGVTAEAARFHGMNFEITTDADGFATLSLDRTKARWIEVFADYMTPCYGKPNLVQFSVDTILSKGLAAPNDCGKFSQPLKPGQFTVFARPSTLREKMAR